MNIDGIEYTEDEINRVTADWRALSHAHRNTPASDYTPWDSAMQNGRDTARELGYTPGTPDYDTVEILFTVYTYRMNE